MIDLVCLVADKSIEAAVEEILQRPAALGIREIRFETIVHPHRDPGCFHEPSGLLKGYRGIAEHAVVVLDWAWDGVPASTGVELEGLLENALRASGLADWARAVVIDPELEAWVFSDSPHVATSLGWPGNMQGLRETLVHQKLWTEEDPKPQDPRAAVEWVLCKASKPQSSSVFRQLASTVSLHRCQDRAFMRFRDLLVRWFGDASRGA